MCAKAISAEGLGAELRMIHRQVGAAAVDGLRTAAQLIRSDVIVEMGEVKPWAPINTTALRGSWQVTNLPDGAAVENPTPYAAVMEYGARPFTPPVGPLRIWAARKLKIPLSVAIELNKRVRGQPRAPRGSRTPHMRAVDGLAFAAKHSIERHGIKGRGFWRATLKKVPKIVESSIDFHLKRVR